MSGFVGQNFMAATSPSSSFLLQTQGYYAGVMLDDPVAQQWIATGVIAQNQTTQAFWAGLPITEKNSGDSTTQPNYGSSISLPGTATAITGFIIANQGYNGIITSANNVPMYNAGMSVSLVRLGSNARIVVPVDSAAVSSFLNGAINQTVDWDFTTNAITNSGTNVLACKLLELNTNSMIVNYVSGYANWTAGTVAVIQI